MEKTFLTVFLHTILYLNIRKMFILKTNCDKWQKVDTVQ